MFIRTAGIAHLLCSILTHETCACAPTFEPAEVRIYVPTGWEQRSMGEVAMPREMFTDRIEAGQRLASALERFRGPDTVILGVPRGGIVVAAQVARALDVPLDVIIARKIGAPGQPELAIGAVVSGDIRLLDEMAIR